MLSRIAKMKEEDGFTLVELLLVIVVLGVLSAVVVFSVRGISDNSKTSACAADKATIATAAEAYYAQNKTYPTAVAQLVPGFLAAAPASSTTVTYSATAAPVVSC